MADWVGVDMSQRTCDVAGCESLGGKRGWCSKHYQRWQRNGDPLVVLGGGGSCEHCGIVIVRESMRGGMPKYCSAKCRDAAAWLRTGKARRGSRADRSPKQCSQCGCNFIPDKTAKQKFCSKSCMKRSHRDSSIKTCTVDACERPLRARGMCAMHWRRWARETGREQYAEWDDDRKRLYHERRARKLRAPAEVFLPTEIYERDAWVCGICTEPVDPTLTYPDPRSVSLDHKTPLSAGGSHTRENTQCSHLSCNVRKGARVA